MKQTAKEKKKLIKDAMALLGAMTSTRKKKSSRTNGKLGGRPAVNVDPKSIARRKKYAENKSK